MNDISMKLKKIRKDKNRNLSELFLEEFPPNSRFAESYRSLRTNIQFSFLDKEFRSLLITSAGAAEGKTASTANLSYTMAQAGKNVLMIDADLRKPMLSTILKGYSEKGLSGLLSESFSVDIREGSLAEFRPSDLFRLASFRKKTGTLTLEEGPETIMIVFMNGEIMDVQWPTRPKEKKLAALLVREKFLTQEQAEEALSRGKETGQRFGFVLINLGFMKKDDLTGFITLHIMEGLRVALQMKTGSFQFDSAPSALFDQHSFNPSDIKKVYNQAVIGQEEFNYLAKEINNCIVKTHVENLSVLPSGSRPPKPAELLGSERMSFLISHLKKQFDVIVIDSPPVLLTSDSVLLAPLSDGVVLIVKSGQMKREAVKKALEQLEIAQANVIGVALNQVDTRKEGYYYKYYSKYYDEEE
jgi:capsular exopolysaccharide synthesis family protein